MRSLRPPLLPPLHHPSVSFGPEDDTPSHPRYFFFTHFVVLLLRPLIEVRSVARSHRRCIESFLPQHSGRPPVPSAVQSDAITVPFSAMSSPIGWSGLERLRWLHTCFRPCPIGSAMYCRTFRNGKAFLNCLLQSKDEESRFHACIVHAVLFQCVPPVREPPKVLQLGRPRRKALHLLRS